VDPTQHIDFDFIKSSTTWSWALVPTEQDLALYVQYLSVTNNGTFSWNRNAFMENTESDAFEHCKRMEWIRAVRQERHTRHRKGEGHTEAERDGNEPEAGRGEGNMEAEQVEVNTEAEQGEGDMEAQQGEDDTEAERGATVSD
jgi:hypothetical protein